MSGDGWMDDRAAVIQAAFQKLQPLCVPLTKTPTADGMKQLRQCVSKLPKDAVEELQEYIMFPLRLLLKKSTSLAEDVAIQTVHCLRVVLERSEVSRWQTFPDVLTSLTVQLGPPQAHGQVRSCCEELKMELVLCIKQLMLATSTSVVSAVYKRDFLPMFGHCTTLLLTVVQGEKHRELCVQAMLALQATAQIHRKVGASVRQALGDMFASFLPGILMALTKVATGDPKQGHKVITTALTLWHEITTLVLGNKNLPSNQPSNQNKQPNSMVSEHQQRLASLSVCRNETWVKATAEKVAILVTKVSGVAQGSGNWRVRAGVVAWAAALLTHCDKSLSGCMPGLLEVLVGLVGDENASVARAAQQALRDQRPGDALLQDNLYTLCTALPRVVRSQDDAASLSSLRTLHGYLSLLGPRVHVVLRSHSHMSKLSQALQHLLTMDTRQIAVLQERTLGSPYSDLNSSEWQERPKKYFQYFHDPLIYTEVVNIVQMLGYYGDFDAVLDPFLSEFEQTTVNRKQAALIINNLLLGVMKDESAVDLKTEQKRDADSMETLVRSLVDMYLSAEYFNLPTSNQSEAFTQTSTHNKAFDWEIVAKGNREAGLRVEQYNSNILQISTLLEGIGGFAKVLGERFQYLLMDVLYPVLEKLGEDNAMVSQSAYLTLRDMAASCQYSCIADLLQQNADYLVDGISLRLRHLSENPHAPTVLRVVVTYCGGPDILPHVQHTLQEVLASLDHHYGSNAVQFMRVLNSLVKSIEKWYPSKYCIVSTKQGLKAVQYGKADTENTAERPKAVQSSKSDTENTAEKTKAAQSSKSSTAENPKAVQSSESSTAENPKAVQSSKLDTENTAETAETNGQNAKESLAEFFLNHHNTQKEADSFDVEGDSGMGSGMETEVTEEEMSEPMEEEKKPPPLHIKMVTEVMVRCSHLLADSDPRLRLLVLDTVAHCSTALVDHTDELLPLVHKVWPAFVQRFSDKEPQVTIKACEVLAVLGQTSEDFIRQRVVKDVLPKLTDYLHKQARISEKVSGPGYRYSVACRLQQCIVGRVGELCVTTGLLENSLIQAVHACLLYLSARQPQYLQQACLDTFKRFISSDPDLVWLTLHDLYCPRPFQRPSEEFKVVRVFGGGKKNEYSENVEKLLRLVNSEQ